ncbi:MAG: APC family permease [Akkermansiaceae bacterium]|nr:APC family permease [Armatimonadota bacterium]
MSFLDRLIGKPLSSHSEDEQKVGPFAAVPMLGLDGLASAAYGPEAALTVLLPLGVVGLSYLFPIMGILLVLLAVLFFSYRQTMAAYPTGGGSYTVSRENLGIKPGLFAAAALLVDYVLVVAVGISAGVGAFVSIFPSLTEYRLELSLFVLALVAIVNLRGAKESGIAFALPTYGFIASLGIVLVIGVVKTVIAGGAPVAVVTPSVLPAPDANFAALSVIPLALLLHAFASGCTAMTGVEAVSNGMSVFRKPVVPTAQQTLTIIVGVLGILLAGIAYLCRAYNVGATPPEGESYQSVLSQLTAAIIGKGLFYYVTLGFTLAVLALSANTGYADFPRLCRLLAQDSFLPHAFENRGRRLVYSLGISVLTFMTALLLIGFGGITDRLIPLFAVGAFGAFTLSQAGMVRYWQKQPATGATRASMFINGLGAIATGIALMVILVAKFTEGAWVTVLLIPGTVFLFLRVRAHYDAVHKEIGDVGKLDVVHLEPPVVVVPIKDWTTIAEKGLQFALSLSPDVMAVHIATQDDDAEALRTRWTRDVTEPLREAGRKPPVLVVLASPYRRLFNPLFGYLNELEQRFPERRIAVIIPELVETHWYQYPLHNQRATALKAALLLRGGDRIVVINVPWYFGAEGKRASFVEKES